MDAWDTTKDAAGRLANPIGNDHNTAPWWDPGGQMLADPGAAAENIRKQQLYNQAQQAGNFAGQAQRNYNQYGQQAQQALNGLQAQANGQNSVSAMQLQQGLQSNLAAQQSMAAGAAPQNAAMAARTAAIQNSRLGSGLAGQQAVAGQAERNQAQGQYASMLGGLRGQDEQAALQARQTATTGYSSGAAGAPEKSPLDKYSGMIGGVLSVFSDRRLKKDIKDGSGAADAALKGLNAHVFSYKDEKHGKGARLGIMAQDLERAGLGHAVINTPRGKMVHGGQLATSVAAMLPGLDKRLSALEGKK